MINEDHEIWKVFPLNSYYLVSDLGRIIGIERKYIKQRVLKQNLRKNGYKTVVLCIDDIKTTWLVHRVVAITFIQNPHNKPQVNHKNGIRDDNRVKNLEWCTASENMKHSFRELGRKQVLHQLGRTGALHNRSKPIKCVTLDMDFVSVTEAAKVLGMNHGDIIEICKGEKIQCNGLTFIYKAI